MPLIDQTDCFNINKKFWKILAIDPLQNTTGCIYRVYTNIVVSFVLFLYVVLGTVNFYYLERKLDIFIEEMVLYFTEIPVVSKVVTFIVMHEEIAKIFKTLNNDVFQPVTDEGLKVIQDAKRFNTRYWKVVAAVSFTSNIVHLMTPLLMHLFMHIKLQLPVCSYSFIPEETKQHFVFPLYLYQSIGMHFCMWCNVNIDTFFLGLMILVVAQLDILDDKLRNITKARIFFIESRQDKFRASKNHLKIVDENKLMQELNESIVHFDEVYKFCSLIQKVFGVTLFVQFGIASIIICVCLFRFTLPAPFQYFIFLATYTFIMIIQILVPCWLGTRIMDKSNALSNALYDCDWIPRPRRFKTNLRLFVERTVKPLSITGWKMFPLSLTTFTSIMNTSYSFFTVLRHMQSRQ